MGYIKNVKIGNDTHLIEPILYGTCSTAADVAEKVVNIPNFELVDGVRIAVFFSNKNTADRAALNVNSTGAKQICYYTSRENRSSSIYLVSGTTPVLSRLCYFIYYNNYWQLEEDSSSLSKYTDDTAHGVITFRKNDSTSNYIRINGSGAESSNYAQGINFYLGEYWTALKASSADPSEFQLAFYNPTRLSGLATPTANTDAATKQYVDTAVSSVTASIEVVRLI